MSETKRDQPPYEDKSETNMTTEETAAVVEEDGQPAAFNANSDEFVSRLIEAVRRQPCLYNSNHEHYGNKHASAQFRASVWQKLCEELHFPDEPHALQLQWKRVRDRYVRERKKRKSQGSNTETVDPNNPNVSSAVRHYENMKWIDEFLVDPPASKSATATPSSSVNDSFYSGQHTNTSRASTGVQQRTPISRLGDGAYSNATTGASRGRKNASPSSTTSEISVGSVSYATPHAQQQTPGPSHIQYRTKAGGSVVTSGGPGHAVHAIQTMDSSQIVTLPGTAANGKGESVMTMIIDSGNFYQTGSQKTYRLVNVSQELDTGALQSTSTGGPRRKRIALQAPNCPPPHRGGQLGDDIILDDGLGESTIIIGQVTDRVIVDQDHLNGGETVVQQHHLLPHASQSSHSRALSIPQIRQGPQANRAQGNVQPQYILSAPQPTYEHDGDLVNTIVAHLANLNDDEKVVTKMNITRILMDARFGRGACARMFREEEQNEMMANAAASSAGGSARR